MAYHIAANAVLVLHLGFILFVVFGALLAWRRPWLAVVHLPVAAWGFWVEFSGSGCPLTALENALRLRAGQGGYTEDFLQHYLLWMIYPSGLTRNVQFMLAAFVVAINALLYGRLLLRGTARRMRLHTGMTEVPPAEEP